MSAPRDAVAVAPAADAGERSAPAPQSGELVSVLIPAYNEESTLEEVIRRVGEQSFPMELVVVDDGSQDGSAALLERLVQAGTPGLRVFRQPVNRGKGAAIRRAIAESRGTIVVIQDADLEYDPSDLPRLLAPILEGHAPSCAKLRRAKRAPPRLCPFDQDTTERVAPKKTGAPAFAGAPVVNSGCAYFAGSSFSPALFQPEMPAERCFTLV